ncbi:flagellar biosynthesis repressor FlbT [Poseidonocella sp. HB161398]|uniref:flagellar biosynthesis repressor FlbT n=1 Tax=Poseidonocella sp. HB161398 TaxID=2320855 RepID=UPI001108DEA8|nr:flagellar biosynthesis repressor FlbT [Poseidonocella sp. HB161398]
MAGLVLKLGPRERFLINGAVIENGIRRSRINILSPNVNILRLRDAIHPEDADTPVGRVCYLAQLVLAGDRRPEEVGEYLVQEIGRLTEIFSGSSGAESILSALDFAKKGNFYQCLKSLRELIPHEKNLLDG